MVSGGAQESGGAWQGDRLLQAVAERLGRSATIALLVSPVGVLFISVARLLIVSDYNPATASAIVSSGGYVDTLLGTVIPLIPLVVPYLALALLFFNRVIPGLLALLATALISPMTMSRTAAAQLTEKAWAPITNANVVTLAFLALAAFIVAIALPFTAIAAGFGTTIRIVGVAVCVALIPTITLLYPLPVTDKFYTQLLRQPWLPAETITLSSGQRFVGYTLADNGTWIEILKDSNRTISYYPDTDITSRQICEISPTATMSPLITLSQAASSPPIACAAPTGPVSASGGQAQDRREDHGLGGGL